MNWFDQSYFMGLGGVMGFNVLAIIVAIVVIVLKGFALWNAVERKEKVWFIALLIINTLGILELIYLYFIVGKWKKKTTNSDNNVTNQNP